MSSDYLRHVLRDAAHILGINTKTKEKKVTLPTEDFLNTLLDRIFGPLPSGGSNLSFLKGKLNQEQLMRKTKQGAITERDLQDFKNFIREVCVNTNSREDLELLAQQLKEHEATPHSYPPGFFEERAGDIHTWLSVWPAHSQVSPSEGCPFHCPYEDTEDDPEENFFRVASMHFRFRVDALRALAKSDHVRQTLDEYRRLVEDLHDCYDWREAKKGIQ